MLSQFVTVVFVLCCGVLWFWSVGCCVCCVVCCFFFLFYLVVWCVGVGPVFCGGVLLRVFCFWCSSGWLWWLCCSVRFFAPGSCVALLVVLGGSWSSSAVLLLVVFLLLLVVDLGCVAPPLFHDLGCSGPAPGLTQNATLVGWLCGVSAPCFMRLGGCAPSGWFVCVVRRRLGPCCFVRLLFVFPLGGRLFRLRLRMRFVLLLRFRACLRLLSRTVLLRLVLSAPPVGGSPL